jgi:hypothetical protein
MKESRVFLFQGAHDDGRRRSSHSDVTLCTFYRESLYMMKYTGWCQNDFNVQGSTTRSPSRGRSRTWRV